MAITSYCVFLRSISVTIKIRIKFLCLEFFCSTIENGLLGIRRISEGNYRGYGNGHHNSHRVVDKATINRRWKIAVIVQEF